MQTVPPQEFFFLDRMRLNKKMEIDVLGWLINWFDENSNIHHETIMDNLEINYLEKSWIDSFKFIKLISDIELKFNFTIDDIEMQNGTLFTLNELCQTIKKNASY